MTPSTLNIPDDTGFIENLVLQRTGPFIQLGGAMALSRWFKTGEKAQLSQYLDVNDLRSQYLERVFAEVECEVDLFMRLITGCSFLSLVSIGPGNGIFEFLLYHKISFGQILLIDIEESEGLHQHGFTTQGSGYASLEQTKKFMALNGVPEDKIVLCNPRKTALPNFEFDVLISLLSMGFHYPCDDYADFILSNVRDDGYVICDKRKGTQDRGFDKLLATMAVRDVMNQPKSGRYFLIKKQPRIE